MRFVSRVILLCLSVSVCLSSLSRYKEDEVLFQLEAMKMVTPIRSNPSANAQTVALQIRNKLLDLFPGRFLIAGNLSDQNRARALRISRILKETYKIDTYGMDGYERYLNPSRDQVTINAGMLGERETSSDHSDAFASATDIESMRAERVPGPIITPTTNAIVERILEAPIVRIEGSMVEDYIAVTLANQVETSTIGEEDSILKKSIDASKGVRLDAIDQALLESVNFSPMPFLKQFFPFDISSAGLSKAFEKFAIDIFSKDLMGSFKNILTDLFKIWGNHMDHETLQLSASSPEIFEITGLERINLDRVVAIEDLIDLETHAISKLVTSKQRVKHLQSFADLKGYVEIILLLFVYAALFDFAMRNKKVLMCKTRVALNVPF